MLSQPLTPNADLRTLEPFHAPQFAAYIDRNRDHLSPWLPWAVMLTDEEQTRAWLQRYADDTARDAGRIYGIWLDGELVGGTLFRTFNARFRLAEIGVWLSPEAEGKGLVTTAARAMIAWAIGERGIHRVEWRTVPENKRSIACAERLGMTLDGTLREAFHHNGRPHDVHVYSLLAPAWTP
ncbi:RimJ/RimL family protein N-acetyltransferase [Allocatelliglobosispora scoriae]|uniref:RimJ/RimL family protein N-acetyltransferase n=1 Tax=Allocatelliglobosispora scoriae TaxID=643052 RepID=A0A841BU49_9ACTN|nr:GNAT family protein [Allocatelliglobosispora scoriae]MBB5870291.1 RimJ/RimL family protein N-acetyltransferase [Allocatelliglobosispora scoriae]